MFTSVAGSHTAVDVDPPASPPEPASFARTTPDRQETVSGCYRRCSVSAGHARRGMRIA